MMRIADWPVGNLLDDPWLALLYKKASSTVKCRSCWPALVKAVVIFYTGSVVFLHDNRKRLYSASTPTKFWACISHHESLGLRI